jgi:hypothetical protein
VTRLEINQEPRGLVGPSSLPSVAYCVFQPGDSTRYEFVLAKLHKEAPGDYLVAWINCGSRGKRAMTFCGDDGVEKIGYIMEKMNLEGDDGEYDAGVIRTFLREAMPLFLRVLG